MIQKYQNESVPIFYYGKSPKTNRKHLKLPYLQTLTLSHVIEMTLYFVSYQDIKIESCLILKSIVVLKSPVLGLMCQVRGGYVCLKMCWWLTILMLHVQSLLT